MDTSKSENRFERKDLHKGTTYDGFSGHLLVFLKLFFFWFAVAICHTVNDVDAIFHLP